MLKKSKVCKIFSLMTVVLIMVSMMLPMTVFAGIDDMPDIAEGDAGVKIVSYSDTGVTADAILHEMAGSTSASEYKSGKVYFKGGKLGVETKGTTYTLLYMSGAAGGTQKILINTNAFKEAKKADINTAMRKFTDAISNVGDNDDTVQQIMKDIQDTDSSVSSIMLPLIFDSSKGDMYAAYKIAKPFLDVLSVVLGVGAVALILFLLFSTVMDLAYIGLPVWREAQANKEGNSGKNPFGVSYEAMTTVKEVEKGLGDGGYKNAYLLYFKRRALTYIILAICIMYLICGGLSGIISFVLSLVSGITG